MDALEFAIPPPIVMLLVGSLMWLLAYLLPTVMLPSFCNVWAAIIIGLAGLTCGVTGVMTFHRAGTTSNPGKTAQVSVLVTSGIYRLTRNPMYFGILLILIGWGIYLGTIPSLICAFVFVPYITRYQIKPEEKLLERKFGDAFISYRATVRRWI